MTAERLLDELTRAGLPADARSRASWTRWSNGPAETYGVHRHDYDKVLQVDQGSISFELGASTGRTELAAGGQLYLPAGTDHAAVVGRVGVTCLELHLPAGTLARLRRAGGTLADAAGPETDRRPGA